MTETSKHDLCLFMLPRLIPDASLEVLHSFKAAEHWSLSDKLEELDLLWTVWPLWHQAMKQLYYLERNFLACYICCLYHSMGSIQVYKRCFVSYLFLIMYLSCSDDLVCVFVMKTHGALWCLKHSTSWEVDFITKHLTNQLYLHKIWI